MKIENMINKVINGDCYKIIKDIPDKSIDCVYIDIPYLYDQGGGHHSQLGKQIERKRLELDENNISSGIDYKIFDELVRVMKKVNIFIWCSKSQIIDIMKYFLDNKKCYFEILTWNKTNPTPSTNNNWLPDIEYCLYFREQGVLVNDGYDLKSKWYISPLNQNDKERFKHPTIKPLPLVERHLKHTTKENDIVLDCFCGSGTTCVACKNIKRRFIGIELNEKWYKVAADRLNNTQVNGQQTFFTL